MFEANSCMSLAATGGKRIPHPSLVSAKLSQGMLVACCHQACRQASTANNSLKERNMHKVGQTGRTYLNRGYKVRAKPVRLPLEFSLGLLLTIDVSW